MSRAPGFWVSAGLDRPAAPLIYIPAAAGPMAAVHPGDDLAAEYQRNARATI